MGVDVEVEIRSCNRPRRSQRSRATHQRGRYAKHHVSGLADPTARSPSARMDFGRPNSSGGILADTYEVVEIVPERRQVVRTADGPFPMETTYLPASIWRIWAGSGAQPPSGGAKSNRHNRPGVSVSRPSRAESAAARWGQIKPSPWGQIRLSGSFCPPLVFLFSSVVVVRASTGPPP